MALQRTRRPRIRSGRSLRSLGSPLNARPLGAFPQVILEAAQPRFRVLSVVLVITVLAPESVSAQQAVRLGLSTNPCSIMVCPCCIFGVTSVPSGSPLFVAALALNEDSALDTEYIGTIQFSSSDPFATLPGSYSFLTSDRGGRGFSAILRTPGVQQITVTDSANILAPGVLTITVTGPSVLEPIPTLSSSLAVILAVAMAVSGLWLLRTRG